MRSGPVPATADEPDLEAVRRRRERPLLRHHLADGEPPVHVRAEDRGHAIERPRVEDRLRPPPGLLGRLQHDQHVAGGGTRRQEMRRAHRPGGVDVVSARVHHARVLRREWQPRFLRDGQRIDVPPYGDRRPGGVAPADAGHDARARDALESGGLDPRQRRLERRGRASFLSRQLWVAVQVAPQLDQRASQRRGKQLGEAAHWSTTLRTVRFSTLSRSTSTPMPGTSRGTRTMPSASMVHSGVTMSRSQ